MEIAKKSIRGNFRKENQDRVDVFQKNNSLFAILCDGMGGHFGGDLAATLVVNFFKKSYEDYQNISPKNCQRWFFDTVESIKKEMRILANNDQKKMDMGTTATAVLVFKNEKTVVIFNVGDSRTYVFTKNDQLKQITRDHNLYNKLISEGIDKKTAEKNLFSHSLTSSIGPIKSTTIEITELKDRSFEKISKIILTSDGVHSFLENEDLVDILKNKIITTTEAVEKIIKTSQLNNSNDNMSAILIKLKEKNE